MLTACILMFPLIFSACEHNGDDNKKNPEQGLWEALELTAPSFTWVCFSFLGDDADEFNRKGKESSASTLRDAVLNARQLAISIAQTAEPGERAVWGVTVHEKGEPVAGAWREAESRYYETETLDVHNHLVCHKGAVSSAGLDYHSCDDVSKWLHNCARFGRCEFPVPDGMFGGTSGRFPLSEQQ